MPADILTGQSGGGNCSLEDLSFQKTVGCVKLIAKDFFLYPKLLDDFVIPFPRILLLDFTILPVSCSVGLLSEVDSEKNLGMEDRLLSLNQPYKEQSPTG